MCRYVVETSKPKYKRMNGYQCNAHSVSSMLIHLSYAFQYKDRNGVIHRHYSEYEMHRAYQKGYIRIIMLPSEEVPV